MNYRPSTAFFTRGFKRPAAFPSCLCRHILTCLATILATAATPALALSGEIATHDPSTVITCNGKYYDYGTGRSIPILTSTDGWTWRRAGSVLSSLPGGRPGPEVLRYAGGNTGTNAWAPDVIKVGDRYFLYYALSGVAHRAVIGLVTNQTLDPESPEYKWEDGGPIAWSLGDGVEELHAIDPGVFHDPNDGSLWLVYGSYYGTIRLMQLDPNTGKRLHEKQSQTIVANNSEASDLIYHDGWYYLFVNHGTCCAGAASTYNIRVGRSRRISGPYLDDHGRNLARDGGTLFLAAGDRKIGPGHFGLLDLGDGVQKFSCHYEADLDYHAVSDLDIRPLLWRDGWPLAGKNLQAGTCQVMSRHAGTVLELDVPGVPVAGRRGLRAPGAAASAGPDGAGSVKVVAKRWPPGTVDLRLGAYLLEAHQQWTLTPVADASGSPGSPSFKIAVAGTGRALAATSDDELVCVPAFTGDAAQLWRLDQLTNGCYRICPKTARAARDKLALTSLGRSAVFLAPFRTGNDNQQWLLKHP